MTSKYEVELITIEDKNAFMEKYNENILYEQRAGIYGCCIKLLTDIKYVKERWEENFYPMSAHVRSHGRMLVTKDSDEKQRGHLEDKTDKRRKHYLIFLSHLLFIVPLLVFVL